MSPALRTETIWPPVWLIVPLLSLVSAGFGDGDDRAAGLVDRAVAVVGGVAGRADREVAVAGLVDHAAREVHRAGAAVAADGEPVVGVQRAAGHAHGGGGKA